MTLQPTPKPASSSSRRPTPTAVFAAPLPLSLLVTLLLFTLLLATSTTMTTTTHGWVHTSSLPTAATTTTRTSARAASRRIQQQRLPLGLLFSSTGKGDYDSTKSSQRPTTFVQRIFYRLNPDSGTTASDVEFPRSVVIEERLRFRRQQSPDNGDDGIDAVVPTGRRSLILRDGDVEDGEIGDEFFRLDVHERTSQARSVDSAVAAALYLASNPRLCSSGSILELSCELGIASILGTVGAGYVSNKLKYGNDKKSVPRPTSIEEEILTVPKASDDLFPAGMESLTLTDPDDDNLDLVLENVKSAAAYAPAPSSKVIVDKLDWTVRTPPAMTRSPGKEYHTIVASDVAYSFPEAKQLARTVANRLLPSGTFEYEMPPASRKNSLPTFVHVCPDTNLEDSAYLHKLLSEGYRMEVSTGYLFVEKIVFKVQTLPASSSTSKTTKDGVVDENESELLDEMELEVSHMKELTYKSLKATHHPQYAGEGSGELFFPIETGLYDGERAGGAAMEREWDRKDPWV